MEKEIERSTRPDGFFVLGLRRILDNKFDGVI
jgi:hypothetical protein